MNYELAQKLMDEFTEATGVLGTVPPRRYLWTDAFAVCNLLGLYRHTGSDRYWKLTIKLVDQVHEILGHHRADDPRRGWISGLSEEQGKCHPTRGGLRIGKKLNERAADQPRNPQLEWEQDGQYFHYLTKWMHALYRVHQETGEDRFLVWAAELAVTAHRAFTYESAPGRAKRMFWKMSVDLTRPLVASMGHHDPLDGLVTCLEMQTSARLKEHKDVDLSSAVADMTEMCQHGRWATDDPLGIGGLLDDAVRLVRLVLQQGVERRTLLLDVLRDSETSLRTYSDLSALSLPAEHRLAFRELGLSIGLRELALIGQIAEVDAEVSALINVLLEYGELAEQIETFWSHPAHRKTASWNDHRDINTVMLATSLAPQAYVGGS